MKILITGASGFLASFVIQRLRDSHELTLFDRQPSRGETADLPFIHGDITDLDAVKTACENQDAVVHLIALVRGRFGMPLEAYCDVMVKGTWNIAEACVQNTVLQLINISSVVADGWPVDSSQAHEVGDSSNFVSADLFYSLAKKLGEEICNAYAQAHGLQVINLRPAVIAGDGANVEPQRPENPPPHWFIHVHPLDVAQAVECALKANVGGTFNITAGREDSIWDWREAREKLGYTPEHNWPEV